MVSHLLEKYAEIFANVKKQDHLFNVVNGSLKSLETIFLACTFSVDGITMLSLGLSIKLVIKGKSKIKITCAHTISVVFCLIFLSIYSLMCFKYQEP